MSARKLWATRYGWPVGELRRHPSKAAAYRFAKEKAETKGHSRDLTVYVDERDGRGWKKYEQINLAELTEETTR